MDKEVKYVCYICKANSFSNQNRGKLYTPVFSLECSLVCVECSNHFIMGYVRTDHGDMDKEVKYVCYMCKRNSSARQNRRNIYTPVFSLESSIVCVECSNHFIMGYVRTDHEEMDKEVKYVCYMCKRYSSARQNRRKVYSSVFSLESSFVCVECSNHFIMGYVRTNKEEPLYACEECGKVYSSEANLRYHSYEHSNAWPYQCEVCGKGLATESHLISHKIRHSDKRPHRCDVCLSDFKRKNYLAKHKKLHDDRNPLRCEQCNKICVSKCSLESHMSVHSDERPFKCFQCDAFYKHKRSLINHIKDHHRDGE